MARPQAHTVDLLAELDEIRQKLENALEMLDENTDEEGQASE